MRRREPANCASRLRLSGTSRSFTLTELWRDFYEHARGALRAEKVILSTGGKSLPKTGSDGSGGTHRA